MPFCDISKERDEASDEKGTKMSESDALNKYFSEIRKVPLLTAEEERDLFERVRKGDREARDRIAEANQRLVIKVARAYQNQALPLVDLIGEGNVGLMRAIDKFDVRRGFKFSTYAIHWIRQAISRAVLQKSHTIKPPIHLTAYVPRYRKAVASLTRELGREPSHTEVARAMQLPRTEVQGIDAANQAIDLVKPLQKFEVLEDIPLDNAYESSAETVERRLEACDEAEQIMKAVSEREREILTMRYGLSGRRPMTLREIGDKLGVTRARIGQLESRALRKMRDRWEELSQIQTGALQGQAAWEPLERV